MNKRPASSEEAPAAGRAAGEDEAGASHERAPGSSAGGAPRRSVARRIWDWTRSVSIAFLLFLFVRAFLVEAFQIPTASMENTLLAGDFLLVNKLAYGADIPGTGLELPALRTPARGDVIVFEPPRAATRGPRANYIKRIVGMPGDTLQMSRAQLLVNGIAQDEPYVKMPLRSADAPNAAFSWQRRYVTGRARRWAYLPTRDNWGPLVVPAGKYFVMGDNRSNSEDSRYWGFVPRDAIKGRTVLVYYSYDLEAGERLGWITSIRWDRILRGVN